MKRRILGIWLFVGALVGFGHGFASLHHHRPPPCDGHRDRAWEAPHTWDDHAHHDVPCHHPR